MRFDFLQGRQVDSLLVPLALRSSLAPSALGLFGIFRLFLAFLPFLNFYRALHRAITKTISESTCGKSIVNFEQAANM